MKELFNCRTGDKSLDLMAMGVLLDAVSPYISLVNMPLSTSLATVKSLTSITLEYLACRSLRGRTTNSLRPSLQTGDALIRVTTNNVRLVEFLKM